MGAREIFALTNIAPVDKLRAHDPLPRHLGHPPERRDGLLITPFAATRNPAGRKVRGVLFFIDSHNRVGRHTIDVLDTCCEVLHDAS